jgi:hypothetical protein
MAEDFVWAWESIPGFIVLDAWGIYEEGTLALEDEAEDESETMNDEKFQVLIAIIDLEAERTKNENE